MNGFEWSTYTVEGVIRKDGRDAEKRAKVYFHLDGEAMTIFAIGGASPEAVSAGQQETFNNWYSQIPVTLRCSA